MNNEELEQMVVNEGGDINIDLGTDEDENLNPEEIEEDVVSIEGVTPPDQEEDKVPAPQWVKDVRKQNRELKQKLKELESKQTRETTEQEIVTLPKKPTMEDFDYDADDYEKALEEWHDKKRVYESKEQEKARQAEAAQKAWQSTVENYGKSKQSLKVRDYDIAEELVTDNLTIEQQAVILQGAENPAAVVYAIGKNKSHLEELSKIKDPVKFAFAIAKMEGKLKVERRSAPEPEKKVQGSASASTVDNTLEKLREEATKTGDMSKLMAYKRQLKKK